MIKYRTNHLRFKKYHNLNFPSSRRFCPVELPRKPTDSHQFHFFSSDFARLSPKVLESFRRVFIRFFKKRRGSLIPIQLTFYPLSCKPKNSRMGKGKGSKMLMPVVSLPPLSPLFRISLRRRYLGFRLWQKRLEAAGVLRRCSRRLSVRTFSDLSPILIGGGA